MLSTLSKTFFIFDGIRRLVGLDERNQQGQLHGLCIKVSNGKNQGLERLYGDSELREIWIYIKRGATTDMPDVVLPEGCVIHYRVYEHDRLVKKGRYLWTSKDGLSIDYGIAIDKDSNWHVDAIGAARNNPVHPCWSDTDHGFRPKTFYGEGTKLIEEQMKVWWRGIDDDLCVDGLFV